MSDPETPGQRELREALAPRELREALAPRDSASRQRELIDALALRAEATAALRERLEAAAMDAFAAWKEEWGVLPQRAEVKLLPVPSYGGSPRIMTARAEVVLEDPPKCPRPYSR